MIEKIARRTAWVFVVISIVTVIVALFYGMFYGGYYAFTGREFDHGDFNGIRGLVLAAVLFVPGLISFICLVVSGEFD